MPDTQSPPLYWQDTDEMARKTAVIVREVLKGKTNNTQDITLTPNSTTTVLEGDEYTRVCCNTVISLSPRTASAAAAQASGSLWIQTNNGRITIHHDSTADTDRTFGAVFTG